MNEDSSEWNEDRNEVAVRDEIRLVHTARGSSEWNEVAVRDEISWFTLLEAVVDGMRLLLEMR